MEHCNTCGRGDLTSHFRCSQCNLWVCRHCFVTKTKLCLTCDNPADPYAEERAEFEADVLADLYKE